MLHQVVGVDRSPVCFLSDRRNSFNIYSVYLVMQKSLLISSVLRFSVIGEDNYSFCLRNR